MDNPRLKISVLIASRGNPEGLRTIIGAMHMLESGLHDVTYVVACDVDDALTARISISHRNSFHPRPPALGTIWNRAAMKCPADIYALVTDRALCVTQNWDYYLVDAHGKDDTRVVWWTTTAGPVIPIVPHKWLEAAGQLYTDYFPFWFDDTWLHELSAMVHGLPNYMVQAQCVVIKKNPVTKRMRDLRFWMDFFIAKRHERMAQAFIIRERLGVHVPDMRPIKEWFIATDKMWDLKWEQWQEMAGDKSEPDAAYVTLKQSAQEFMDEQSQRP